MSEPFPPFDSQKAGSSSEHSTQSFSQYLEAELHRRHAVGENLRIDEYIAKYREFEPDVRRVFSEWDANQPSRESFSRSADSTAVSPAPGSTVATPNVETLVGKYLGRYRIDQFLGRGGFGEVWKGFDPELSRVVAVKLARRDRTTSTTALDRFVEEARKAASLSHPGIVQVYDIAKMDEGCVIVSEFIDGESLSVRIRKGPVPLGFAVSTVIDIAWGLHHAHLRDLIHRDVKPGNILLRTTGGAVLTDFGLAVYERELTHESDTVSGTIRYMSPEQARGDSAGLDYRTDIFSLGLVLYTMLTGRLPYPESDTDSYIRAVSSRPPRPIRSIVELVPPELEKICMKALAFSAEDRQATCQELSEALEAWQGTCTEAESTRILVAPTPRKWSPVWLLGTVGALGVVLSLGVIQLQRYTPPAADGPVVVNGGMNEPAKPVPPLPPVKKLEQAVSLVITAEGWTSLLGQEPKLIAWESSEGRGPPQFEASLKQFRVRSERTRWLFQCSEQNAQPFQVRTVIRVQDWLGSAGVVWGLQEDEAKFPEEWFRGVSIEYFQSDAREPSKLVARQVRLKRRDFDEIRIEGGRQIDFIEIPPPQNDEAVLEVDVNKQGVIARFGGQEWRPTDILDDTEWLPSGLTAIGITGQGANVEFKSLSIRTLP